MKLTDRIRAAITRRLETDDDRALKAALEAARAEGRGMTAEELAMPFEQYVNEREYAKAAGITVEQYRARVDEELAEVENPEAAFERYMGDLEAQAEREEMQARYWASSEPARWMTLEDAQVDANLEYAEREVERVEAQYGRVRDLGGDVEWTAREELKAKAERLREAGEAYDAHLGLGEDDEDADRAAYERNEAVVAEYKARIIPEYGVAYEDLDQYQLADYHEAQDAERERVADVDAAHSEALVEDAGRDMDALNEQLHYMPWPSADKAALRADLAAAQARYDELVEEEATARAEAAQERAIDQGEAAVEEVQVAEERDPTNPSNALTYSDPAVRAAIRAEVARNAVAWDQEEADLAREYVDVHGHTPESAKANAAIERAEAEAVDLEELEAESREAVEDVEDRRRWEDAEAKARNATSPLGDDFPCCRQEVADPKGQKAERESADDYDDSDDYGI